MRCIYGLYGVDLVPSQGFSHHFPHDPRVFLVEAKTGNYSLADDVWKKVSMDAQAPVWRFSGVHVFFSGSKETTKSAWCNDIMIIVLIVII